MAAQQRLLLEHGFEALHATPLGGSLTSSSALQRTSLCCCSLPRPRRSVCTRLLPAGCYMRSARCMRCAYDSACSTALLLVFRGAL